MFSHKLCSMHRNFKIPNTTNSIPFEKNEVMSKDKSKYRIST